MILFSTFFRNIFIFFSFLFLINCNKSNKSNKDILKINLSEGLYTLDPAFSKDLTTAWMVSNIYNSIFELDNNTELTNILADSVTLSNDKKTYTIKLKDNIYFHKNICFGKDSTRLLNSNDIKYSLERLLDPNTASTGAWVLKDKLRDSNAIEIIDNLTVRLTLKKPLSHFLKILSMQYCAIIPKEAVKYYGVNFRKNPVGTGPYSLKVWDEDKVLFLKKNDLFFLKDSNKNILPYITNVKVTFNENKKIEFLELVLNKIDMIRNIDQSIIEDVLDNKGLIKHKYSSNIKLIQNIYYNTEYLAINSQNLNNSPMKYLSFRKAMSMAIDREKLSHILKKDLVYPANSGFCSKGIYQNSNSNNSIYLYNPELSKVLVKNLIVDKNINPSITLHINNSFSEMAEFLANEFKNVGINCKIALHPAETMMQLAISGKIDFFRRSWTADYSDAESFFTCFYSTNTTPPNYTRFKSKEFDILYIKLLETNETKIKEKLIYQMENIIRDSAYVIPLYYEKSNRLINKEFINFEQNNLNSLDLKKVKFNK